MEEKIRVVDDNELLRKLSELRKIKVDIEDKLKLIEEGIKSITPEEFEILQRAYSNIHYKITSIVSHLDGDWDEAQNTYSINTSTNNKPKMKS